MKSALSAPVRRISAYGRATYALGDDIRLSFDASHADVRSVSDTRPDSNFADLLIRADNAFLPAAVRAAIVAAQTSKEPIKLLVKNGPRYREVAIDYHGGPRYPRLQTTGTGETGLDKLLMPR